MYKAWAAQQVQDNEDYIYKYDYHYAKKGIRVVFCKRTQKVIMTYLLFRMVLETYNVHAGDALISGEFVSIDPKLGSIQAARIERSYINPKVDVIGTVQARRKDPKHPTVYFVDEDYCRLRWRKARVLKEVLLSAYEFIPAKHSLRDRFSRALKANSILKFNYVYCPIPVKEDKAA